MAEDKKGPPTGGKKEEKKESKPPASTPELNALYWVIGIIIVASLLLTRFEGTFFETGSQPVEDPQTGRVVGTDKTIKFPIGDIQIGDEIILKSESFVRSAPAHSLLGKQKRYETATVQEGPLVAFDQNWWRVNFENAPDGWVPEYSMTRYVTTYKSLHIIPIIWKPLKPILWVLAVILGILYAAAVLRLKGLRQEAKEKLKAPVKTERMPISKNHIVVGNDEQEALLTAGDRRSNERWMHIVQLLQSHNQNDWRQAIIEADIILEEMLDKMGYDGVTIGDKLKSVEKSDFLTLNQAWEAHKVRNRIAHMGSEFQVSHRDAEKVINLYQEVFNEFYYI